VENAKPLLEVRRLSVQYPLRGRWPWNPAGTLRAVEEVNFNLRAGETLGIVGESGCGKSTLARTLVGLQRATSGAINFDGRSLLQLDEAAWRPLRREIQMVFQDPLASLDPRMSVGRIVEEPLLALCPELSAAEREERVAAMLERVGLSRLHVNRYPHEFSGGQCQRVGIARALVVRPRLLICDEPVSALDVSVQAQIINLLTGLQREYGLAMIFIAHDLAVVRHISHRVMVMYLGRMMEQADRDTLFAAPAHPYTKALLAAAPSADPLQVDRRQRQMLEGEIPSAANPPPGCVFATRCPMADEHCARQVPHVRTLGNGNVAACHYLAAA
jgi:oligopeptide transport system ATP-binding protein